MPDLAPRSGQLPTTGCPLPVASVVAQPGHTQVMLTWSMENTQVAGRSLVVDDELSNDPAEEDAPTSDPTEEPIEDAVEELVEEPIDDPADESADSEGDEVAVEEEELDDANEAPTEAVQPVATLDRPVTSFLIQVTPGDRLVSVGGDTRSTVISGLRNGTEYTFTVFPSNELGRGDGVQAKATPLNGIEGEVAGLLVKFTDEVSAGQESVPGEERVNAVDLAIDRAVSSDVHLVTLSDAVDVNTAQRIATELAADPQVEWAEPDQFVFIAQSDAESRAPPNDALFADQQWNLWDEFGVGLANGNESVNPAWSEQLGAGVTVAVVDTGITAHPDLEGQTVAGYDFVSSPAHLAAPREPDGPSVDFDADGQPGWDADPTDPGDWRKVAPVRESTWHGTHIAGIIAARANNAEGITGLAPGARIQPVRAISWRGGLLSDITAAITWASGGDVAGVPANSTASRVINLSFSVQSPCTPALQSAITGANARGSVVVAAAGNANDDVANFAPANCEGTIAVAATGRDGKRAPYSNYGAGIDVAAPGGSLNGSSGVLSTSNPAYATREGTSIAAAHVSAIATRLLGQTPTATPADVRKQLTAREAVRPFADDACDADSGKTCGSGITRVAQIASEAGDPASLDITFNPGTAADSGVTALAVQPDGKIVIVGWFTAYNGTARSRIARLNVDGSLDTSFNPGSGVECIGAPWCAVWAVAIQADGKVVISGDFNRYNGRERIRIARLNTDGTLDESFNPGTGTNWAPLGLAIQNDGKIIIGGDFVTYNGTPRNNIARLNADGSLDTSFNPGSGAGPAPGVWRGLVYSVAVQPDGKILIGGEFTRYDGYDRNRIARVNTDGSLDTSFNPGSGANGDVGRNSIAVQPDGKILIAGAFTSYNGTLRNRITRLNSDGSLDATFSPGVGASNTVSGLALQVDGKVIIGGDFTAFNQVARNRLARLNSDGSLDTAFDPGEGANQNVGPIAVQTDGKIVIGGDFTRYGGTAINRVAQLTGNRPPIPSPPTPGTDGGVVSPTTPESSSDPRPRIELPPLAESGLTVRRPGSALVRVVDANGIPVRGELPITVVPLPRRDGKIVRAPSWDVELQGVEESGAPAPLNAAGNLEVVQGRGLATSGRGFAPDSAVGVYLFSEPRTLGTLTTNARGAFSGTVPVPADVPVGVHTAQVSGYTPNGDILIVSLGIEVAAPQASPLLHPLPSRVQPLWWMPVTNADGDVVIQAGSSGCSATDGGDNLGARGRSLVFWGLGECVFEVRAGGKTWKRYRIPIVRQALRTEGVQDMATRKVPFDDSGNLTPEGRVMLARVRERVNDSQASYAYWIESRDPSVNRRVSRMFGQVENGMRPERGPSRLRVVTVPVAWQPDFEPDPTRYVLVAWQPR